MMISLLNGIVLGLSFCAFVTEIIMVLDPDSRDATVKRLRQTVRFLWRFARKPIMLATMPFWWPCWLAGCCAGLLWRGIRDLHRHHIRPAWDACSDEAMAARGTDEATLLRASQEYDEDTAHPGPLRVPMYYEVYDTLEAVPLSQRRRGDTYQGVEIPWHRFDPALTVHMELERRETARQRQAVSFSAPCVGTVRPPDPHPFDDPHNDHEQEQWNKVLDFFEAVGRCFTVPKRSNTPMCQQQFDLLLSRHDAHEAQIRRQETDAAIQDHEANVPQRPL